MPSESAASKRPNLQNNKIDTNDTLLLPDSSVSVATPVVFIDNDNGCFQLLEIEPRYRYVRNFLIHVFCTFICIQPFWLILMIMAHYANYENKVYILVIGAINTLQTLTGVTGTLALRKRSSILLMSSALLNVQWMMLIVVSCVYFGHMSNAKMKLSFRQDLMMHFVLIILSIFSVLSFLLELLILICTLFETRAFRRHSSKLDAMTRAKKEDNAQAPTRAPKTLRNKKVQSGQMGSSGSSGMSIAPGHQRPPATPGHLRPPAPPGHSRPPVPTNSPGNLGLSTPPGHPLPLTKAVRMSGDPNNAKAAGRATGRIVYHSSDSLEDGPVGLAPGAKQSR